MIKNIIVLLFVALCFEAQAQFEQKTVSIGNIGLNITNAGTVGRPQVRSTPQGTPSMEYPLNSGIEHLFEAGIWIGAQLGGQVTVSTGAIDDASGYSTGKSGFEFSPLPGAPVIERSSLTSSPVFSSQAVSHQDFEFKFTDEFTIVPGTSQPISNHLTPLNARVKLQSYAYNFSFADFFVILNYEITNNGTLPWDSVWLGVWSDLVVRNVNVSNDGGAAFFSKGSVGYVDSMQAIYAYDISGDPGFTNSYGAIQILGIDWRNEYFHPNNAQTFQGQGLPIPTVNGNYWIYNVQAPTNDLLRYDRMKQRSNFVDPSLNAPGNRVQLNTIGPLVQVAAGETVKFAVAYVCARQIEDNTTPGIKDTPAARVKLLENLSWAKRTYVGEDLNENGILDDGEDLNGNGVLDRYILPEPPKTPAIKVVPESNKVTIYWDKESENSIDPISKLQDFEGYRLYRTKVGDDLKSNFLENAALIRQWDLPNNSIGFNNGFDAIKLAQPITFEGDTNTYTYKYEVENLLNGWQYAFILTAFDRGNDSLGLPSLESSFIANTYRAFPGTDANEIESRKQDRQVGVYPNPYRLGAAWDGSTQRTKKIMFYNLPAQSEIRIYTISGDVVATIRHNADEIFGGSENLWYDNFGDANQSVNPAGEHAWDVLSETKQTIASGMYLYSVKDLKTGKTQTGKIAILK